ncbi:MAG: hypothetical protein L3K26_20830 [Candidatus Hydrogenedentes bacterium]|nr:hypothetical protein [Candidatus Hydrogenedentota bacterium]
MSKVFAPGAPDCSAEPEDMQYGLSLAQRYATLMGGGISLEYRQSDITALTIHFTGKKVASEIRMDGKNEPRVGAA